MKRIVIVSTVVILAAACLSWSTTIRPMSLDRLTSLATSIVEAHVNQTWSDWDPAHSRIYTYTRLTVTKSFKGTQPSTILVKQPGGTKDGIREVAFGVRHFRPGEDAFLFLESDSAPESALRVVGLIQGNFLVYKTPDGALNVTNGVPQVSVIDSQGRLSPYSGAHMTLQDLESRVSKAVVK